MAGILGQIILVAYSDRNDELRSKIDAKIVSREKRGIRGMDYSWPFRLITTSCCLPLNILLNTLVFDELYPRLELWYCVGISSV